RPRLARPGGLSPGGGVGDGRSGAGSGVAARAHGLAGAGGPGAAGAVRAHLPPVLRQDEMFDPRRYGEQILMPFAVVLAAAWCIRMSVELLEPVWPVLLVVALGVVVWRVFFRRRY